MSNLEYLGPLKYLVGNWSGTGFDTTVQEKDVPYFHELEFTPIPVMSFSAGKQVVNSMRFFSKMWAHEEQSGALIPVYEENGYIGWQVDKNNPEMGNVIKQVSNPRGISFMASSGAVTKSATRVQVSCSRLELNGEGVLQSPTCTDLYDPVIGYKSEWEVCGNTLHITDTTELDISSGKSFPQTDRSTLARY